MVAASRAVTARARLDGCHTIDWLPARNTVNYRETTWERFAELMEEHGIARQYENDCQRRIMTVRREDAGRPSSRRFGTGRRCLERCRSRS
jgi:hypothetical protein